MVQEAKHDNARILEHYINGWVEFRQVKDFVASSLVIHIQHLR